MARNNVVKSELLKLRLAANNKGKGCLTLNIFNMFANCLSSKLQFETSGEVRAK